MQDAPSNGLLKADAVLAVGEGLRASDHETALGLPADDEVLAPLLDEIAESEHTTFGALDPGWVVYTKRTGRRVAINVLVKHLVLDKEQARVLTQQLVVGQHRLKHNRVRGNLAQERLVHVALDDVDGQERQELVLGEEQDRGEKTKFTKRKISARWRISEKHLLDDVMDICNTKVCVGDAAAREQDRMAHDVVTSKMLLGRGTKD
jgi:hypothetical protein